MCRQQGDPSRVGRTESPGRAFAPLLEAGVNGLESSFVDEQAASRRSSVAPMATREPPPIGLIPMVLHRATRGGSRCRGSSPARQEYPGAPGCPRAHGAVSGRARCGRAPPAPAGSQPALLLWFPSPRQAGLRAPSSARADVLLGARPAPLLWLSTSSSRVHSRTWFQLGSSRLSTSPARLVAASGPDPANAHR